MAAIARTLTRAYFHNGTWSQFRRRGHGRPVDVLTTPGHRFVGYLQNHDQVGNRAKGDRIADRATAELVKVAAGLVLTAPCTPMLFMGEEWGATTPWQYFTDHTDPLLASTIAAGRRADLAAFGWGDAEMPDPQDEATFRRSKLDWSQLSREPHREMLCWYRDLITLRRGHAELTDPRLDRVHADYDDQRQWLVVTRGRLRITANLSRRYAALPLGAAGTGLLAASSHGVRLDQDRAVLPGTTFAIVAT
jgi:maltooligosyltrehalose trehalohydrolase